ncbi:MAG: thioredoxin [Fibrobacterales bacterium]
MVNELTATAFDEAIASADGPVLIDFWAAWCGPCRMLGTILNELSDDDSVTGTFYKVNADENPGLVDKYSITSLPTVMIFENGTLKNSIVGVRPLNVYKELLL